MADTVGETFYSFHGEILSKIIARTGRRQLDGQHMLFGVYLQSRTDLYLLNFSVKMHYRYKLNIDRVSFSFVSLIQCFFFFFNFSGAEKAQEDAVPRNNFENDAAKGSMTGDVVVCFLN